MAFGEPFLLRKENPREKKNREDSKKAIDGGSNPPGAIFQYVFIAVLCFFVDGTR